MIIRQYSHIISIFVASISVYIVTRNLSDILVFLPSIFLLYLFKGKIFENLQIIIISTICVICLMQISEDIEIFNKYYAIENYKSAMTRYRPSGIFPANVYLCQFLILSLIVMKRDANAILVSVLAMGLALTGSTAGWLAMLIGCFMLTARNTIMFFSCFVTTIAIVYLIWPKVISYNFSATDVKLSFGARLEPDRMAITSNANAIGIPIDAMFILLSALAVNIVLWMVPNPQKILRYVAIALLLGLTQWLHPIWSSLFFAFSIATIVLVSEEIIADFKNNRSTSSTGIY